MQYVSKAKGRWNDLMLYLVHINAPNKHQYPLECVISNFDYSALIKHIDTESRKEKIVCKIVAGEILEFNYHKEISETEYVKFKSAIEKAFQYRTSMLKRLAEKWIAFTLMEMLELVKLHMQKI